MFDPKGLLDQLQRLQCLDQIVVAYSGGLDSSVLLRALAALYSDGQIPAFRAIHVHHGISPDASVWQAHCEQVCGDLRVPLHVEKVVVVAGSRGLEDAAREARYDAISEFLKPGDNLLTAQHLDDQAETVLLRLLRGSGPRGLGAMREVRALGVGRIVRPLLCWGRVDLLDYANRCGISWVEDSSNADLHLDRNYLRHQVMPALARRWPRYAANLARSARLARDADQALQAAARSGLLAVNADNGSLCVDWLRGQPVPRQGALLQEWARILGLPAPGARAIREILNVVLVAAHDRLPEIQWGPAEARAILRRYRDLLYLGKLPQPHDASLRVPWDPKPATLLPDGSTMHAEQCRGAGIAASLLVGSDIEIRFRQGGERCRPSGRSGSHPLKKIFQELAVPPWQRDRVPLIYNGQQLLAVAGYFVCDGCVAGRDQRGWKLSWEPREIEAGEPI